MVQDQYSLTHKDHINLASHFGKYNKWGGGDDNDVDHIALASEFGKHNKRVVYNNDGSFKMVGNCIVWALIFVE